MNTVQRITGARVIIPTGIIPNGFVTWVDGTIVEVGDDITHSVVGECHQQYDAHGSYVAPGCIDMHVHGAAGHDFMEATPEAFDAVRLAHAQHGTTSLLATLAVSPPDVIDTCITITDEGLSRRPGAQLLGLHLEGNYINPLMKGAQDPRYITAPQPDEYQALLRRTRCIRRWSAAPELPGALEFARYARLKDTLVALAHTCADYAQVRAAYDAGFTHATHFYNAMTSVHKEGIYKHEGTVEAVYLTDGITVEVIADGIHVPPSLLRLVYKLKGASRTALVTDAMCAAACDTHTSTTLFDPRTVVEDGVCKLADGSALAGSIATADVLIRTMVRAGIPLPDVMRMAADTPARILGIDDRKGTLSPGKDADIIVFDDDIRISSVFIAGQPLFIS